MSKHIPHLPNLFILGARRAGTGSLTHYLSQHPTISFVEPRDPAFFQQDDLYHRGSQYYIRTFGRPTKHQTWLGEATSSYFAQPHIVGPRLRETYGDSPLKFIVVLRDPVSRAWSHYLMRVQHGDEKRDFATALSQEDREPPNSEAGYLTEGSYMHHLSAWQAYYPLENFLLLLSEDLAANPLAQVQRVCTWLGVEATIPIGVRERLNIARYNHSSKLIEFVNHPPRWLQIFARRMFPDTWHRYRIRHTLRERLQTTDGARPTLDPQIAHKLRQSYRDEILSLSKHLGRYLSHWLAEDEMEEQTPNEG